MHSCANKCHHVNKTTGRWNTFLQVGFHSKGILWVLPPCWTSLKKSWGKKKSLNRAYVCPPFPPPLTFFFLYYFCTYCLNRGWQGLKPNEAICLLPETCPPEKKFSPFLWKSKGSGTSWRESWNRPDSKQDYCEEEQKDAVKKARNILFILLISHTVCQNLSLLNDHIQAPALSQQHSCSQPGLPGEWGVPKGQSAHRCGECAQWWQWTCSYTLGQYECGVLPQSSYLVYTGNPVRAGPLTLQRMGGVWGWLPIPDSTGKHQ